MGVRRDSARSGWPGEQSASAGECSIHLTKKKEKLHLLLGLQKILLDIDKAIRIIRETELEEEVVPNLMIGFGIDEIQAEYVAEIKLRQHQPGVYPKAHPGDRRPPEGNCRPGGHSESPRRIKAIIVGELENVAKKYGTDRRTTIRYEAVEEYQEEQQEVPDYPVNLFVTRDGYLKKITPQSLRMSGEQKLKEGDRLVFEVQTTNRAEVLVFTDRCQVYKNGAERI